MQSLLAYLGKCGGYATYSEVDLPPHAYEAEKIGLATVNSDGGWGAEFVVELTNAGREAVGLPRSSLLQSIYLSVMRTLIGKRYSPK